MEKLKIKAKVYKTGFWVRESITCEEGVSTPQRPC